MIMTALTNTSGKGGIHDYKDVGVAANNWLVSPWQLTIWNHFDSSWVIVSVKLTTSIGVSVIAESVRYFYKFLLHSTAHICIERRAYSITPSHR